ncbi:hypothetical protein MSG28_011060 [Choristoneura fumiferana]|uniref:Uncharacterized protein n=1 Tax=Choristoneura fumiferana TaxID=7141 RepID=A0ACC0KQ25_CHOFU|nr:hypothetical protein MSG28_011060 [Choristoneura fumiferana]
MLHGQGRGRIIKINQTIGAATHDAREWILQCAASVQSVVCCSGANKGDISTWAYVGVTWVLLALALCDVKVLNAESGEIEELTGLPKRCSYDYAYGYYGAYCADLGLNKIPSLKSGVEILDFSENKLREIKATCFSDYSGLRMLYLADNKIYHIEENALASLTYLQSLDLSRNVITHVPPSLFQLPALKKLHLSGNPLTHMDSSALSKPIRAPIEYLDISDCGLTEIWNWGILPQLLFYNISQNSLRSLDVSHFVEMCNLRKVDMSKSIDRIRLCDIKPSIKWLQQRRVDYLLLDDSHVRLKSRDNNDSQRCGSWKNSDLKNKTDRAYGFLACEFPKSINSIIQDNFLLTVPVADVQASRSTWARLCGGLAGFLIGFMLLLYLFHRYNVAKIKRMTEKKKVPPPIQGDKQSSELLLNEVSSA